jgi:hypothetical protein
MKAESRWQAFWAYRPVSRACRPAIAPTNAVASRDPILVFTMGKAQTIDTPPKHKSQLTTRSTAQKRECAGHDI